jgi:hypothetical protein
MRLLRLLRPLTATVFGLVVLMAGCTNPPSQSGTADAAVDPPDAGAGVDAGQGADAGPDVRTGFITMSSNRMPPQARISATFLEGGPAYRCPAQQSGPCAFLQCERRTPLDPLPLPTSGTVSITGGSTPVTLVPDGDGFYDVEILTQALWMDGDVLTVAGSGGDVLAFQDTVAVPARLALTAPAIPSGVWMLPRANDVVFSWTGATTEEVVIILGTLATNDPTEVECRFPGSAGTGAVPAAALALLPSGQGYFSVAGSVQKRLAVGDWSVTLRAESDAVLPGNGLAYGELDLQ